LDEEQVSWQVGGHDSEIELRDEEVEGSGGDEEYG